MRTAIGPLVGALFLAPPATHAISVHIPHSPVGPVIDGQLNEALWAEAAPVSLHLQTRPIENGPAPVVTQARLIASQDTLYVAFDARDPEPAAIRAHLTDRDKSWSDDLVGIKLDTWNQSRLAYQFFVNPVGVQHDSIENELTGRESDAWDGIWQSAGQITEQGYQVEMALPLRLFNFDANLDEQIWGIELVRFHRRENDYRLSATPQDRNIACTLCQLGQATGLAGAEPGNQLQITPSLTVNQMESRDQVDDGNGGLKLGRWDKDTDVEPGLDVRWGITADTLLNLTVNPDFSQVEADQGQLDVNTTFALFFPEKRPFYLDNADNFATQVNLVHTRNLAEPDFGTKITGQKGRHVYGLLQTRDAQTNFLLPGNLGSSIAELGESSDNFAGRYLYDSGRDWTLGTLATYRRSDDYHNLVAGVDGRWEITDQHRISAVWLASDTEYPEDLSDQFCDGDCSEPGLAECEFGDCDFNEQVLRAQDDGGLTGQLFQGRYDYESRHWYGFAQLYYTDEEFRGDLGFLDKIDFVKGVIGGRRTWYPSDGFFHRIEFGGDVDQTENVDGELIEREAELSLELAGRHDSFFELYATDRERRGQRNDGSSLGIEGNAPLFDETYFGGYGEIRPVKAFKFGVGARHGDEIDFANNELGTVTRINGWFNWKPNPYLTAHVRHVWQELDVDDGTLFTANLSDVRLTWQFDLRNFLRVTAIYQDVERAPERYRFYDVDATDNALSTEILYGYKLNPQTVFYAGYADGRFENDSQTSLAQDSRTLFMKFSYAWLL